MDLLAAQLFLADLEAAAGLDHGRSADEELAGVLDHHVEVAVGGDHGGAAGDGAEHDGDDGRAPEQVVDAGAAADLWADDVGVAELFKVAHAAAGGVEQAHKGDAVHVGVADRPAALFADEAVGGAAADREVVALHRDFAPVDAGDADDAVGGGQRGELVAVPLGAAGEDAGLAEAVGIDEQVDSLADGQLAAAFVEGDIVGAAHLPGQLGAALDFVEFGLPRRLPGRLPGHGRLRAWGDAARHCTLRRVGSR